MNTDRKLFNARMLDIMGGTLPYSVSQSNSILEIPPSKTNQFMVYAIKPGTTILTIKDSKGLTLTREVIVYDPSTLPLSLGTLPNAVNPVAVGQGRGFSISGGKTPYKVAAANPGIARVDGPSAAGGWFVCGVAAGTTQIIVTDAAGTKVQGTVYVGATKPLSIRANATLLPNGKGELNIDSGNPPYTVTTSANLAASLQSNDSSGGAVYILTAKAPGQGTVTVKDSKGQTVSRNITVIEWVTLAFPDLTGDLRTIDVGQTTRLTVTGGQAPYTVTVDQSALATVQQQAAGRYTVTGRQAGVVVFTVKDASGATRTLSLTVRALPTLTMAVPATLTVGTTGTLSLIGGASPFTVTVAGNAFTLTKVEDKKYTLTPKTPGTATITVKDAKGTTQQKTVTVTAAMLTLTGDTSPLQVGYTRPFDIKGGVGPYTLTLSNGNVQGVLAATTATYTRYNITGITPGTVPVTAKDSQGKTAAVTVTVQAAAIPLKLSVSSTTLQLGATGAAAVRALTIQGGTAPYTATVSGSALTLTQGSATQYQMTPKAAGTATITVKDAKGATAQVTMTVTAPAAAPQKLQISAPASLRISRVGIGTMPIPGTMTVQGGTAPYKVTISDSQVVHVSESGGKYTLLPLRKGTAVVTVRDAKGQTVSHTVTVS